MANSFPYMCPWRTVEFVEYRCRDPTKPHHVTSVNALRLIASQTFQPACLLASTSIVNQQYFPPTLEHSYLSSIAYFHLDLPSPSTAPKPTRFPLHQQLNHGQSLHLPLSRSSELPQNTQRTFPTVSRGLSSACGMHQCPPHAPARPPLPSNPRASQHGLT